MGPWMLDFELRIGASLPIGDDQVISLLDGQKQQWREAIRLRELPKFVKSASLIGVTLSASRRRRLRCGVGRRPPHAKEAPTLIASTLQG